MNKFTKKVVLKKVAKSAKGSKKTVIKMLEHMHSGRKLAEFHFDDSVNPIIAFLAVFCHAEHPMAKRPCGTKLFIDGELLSLGEWKHRYNKLSGPELVNSRNESYLTELVEKNLVFLYK